MRTVALTQIAFLPAALAWLESRKPYISLRTSTDYRFYIKTLGLHFGEMRLPEITADDIRLYQRMRMTRAGASIINKECSVLQQILKRIGCWGDIAPNYQPLPLPKESPGRALTPAEEDRIDRIGPTNPNWDVAYCASVISRNTTAGPGEIRHLRLMDVNLEELTMRVQPEGAKNEHRIRVIPLNELAEKAVRYLLARAKSLGSTQPHHYLLPFRVHRNRYDPERPCMGWRTAHDEMMAACGIECRRYDFRHHAITKLLEDPDTSEETAESIAGHISRRMKKRYSHTRIEAKRAAVNALQAISRKRR